MIQQTGLDGDTRLEVLGWIIDTEALTVTLPSRKRLREVLCVWFLRQTHGRSARIVFCCVDVKELFFSASVG